MTVAELIAELKKLPPAALVVMSRDAEGNGYSPLHAVDRGTADEFDIARVTNDERAALDHAPVVCFWPR